MPFRKADRRSYCVLGKKENTQWNVVSSGRLYISECMRVTSMCVIMCLVTWLLFLIASRHFLLPSFSQFQSVRNQQLMTIGIFYMFPRIIYWNSQSIRNYFSCKNWSYYNILCANYIYNLIYLNAYWEVETRNIEYRIMLNSTYLTDIIVFLVARNGRIKCQ